jgi:hypothetical protein
VLKPLADWGLSNDLPSHHFGRSLASPNE